MTQSSLKSRRATRQLLQLSALTLCLSACGEPNTLRSARPDGSDRDEDASTQPPSVDGSSPWPEEPIVPPPIGNDPRDYARVLFSGHSLLDNPIPDFVEAIARAKGDDYNWEQQNIVGSPLRIRTNGDTSINGSSSLVWHGYSQGKNKNTSNKSIPNELRSPTGIGANERYDTLITLERNDTLLSFMYESTIPLVRDYHDLLRKQNPNARTLYLHVWHGYINKSAAPNDWINFTRIEQVAHECVAEKVNLSLVRDGFPRNVIYVPYAPALARFIERALAGQVPGIAGSPADRLNAILTDDVHLTQIGAYFAGAVIYAAMMQKSPEGANAGPRTSSPDTIAAAERIAWEVVGPYFADGAEPWRHSTEHCLNEVADKVVPGFKLYHFDRINLPDNDQDNHKTGMGDPGNPNYWRSNSTSPFRWPDTTLPLRP